ncbi:hypothetical protein Dimus_032426 [Dionaea muscipula]
MASWKRWLNVYNWVSMPMISGTHVLMVQQLLIGHQYLAFSSSRTNEHSQGLIMKSINQWLQNQIVKHLYLKSSRLCWGTEAVPT